MTIRNFPVAALLLCIVSGCSGSGSVPYASEAGVDCEALACDDGNPCTVDSCDTTDGCSSDISAGLSCDDGSVQTRDDACDDAGECVGLAIECPTGVCIASGTPNGIDCDLQFLEAGTRCDDEDFGTNEDACDATHECVGQPIVCPTGQCIASATPNGEDCDVEYAANGTDCDDGDLSTGTDACNDAHDCLGVPIACPTGQCIASATPNGADCDVEYADAGVACDDDDLSTRDDVCDGMGACGGTPGPCTGLGCEECADQVEWPDEWFDVEIDGPMDGVLELGQTHIVRSDESRIAPRMVEGRETLILFTPAIDIPVNADMRVAIHDDNTRVAVLRMTPPAQLPGLLEQDLTRVPLDPYSLDAWSFFLPYQWAREGVRLQIAVPTDEGLLEFPHTVSGLGAPHVFTVNRTKIVLFGRPDDRTNTTGAQKLAHDFFGSVPAASLNLVDALPWRLDRIVVRTADGPRFAENEAHRLELTDGRNRYGLFRHHVAFRTALANTGRGLSLTGESDVGNSPYSYGTSVGLGWIRDQNDGYRDINNGGVAGGWTGWSAIWAGECGNAFIHELGHSMTMAHFTDGTGNRWGIGDEYPQDGTNLAGHPWGYDTSRRQIRTWYRVNGAGPVFRGETFQGKRDPMNGGESSNSITCFPQYTAFHARKAQRWMQNNPTIREVNGESGVYRWNPETHSYDPHAVAERYETPVAVGVPVMVVTGTLGNIDDVCQTYPPIHNGGSNVFTLPDPESNDLHESFNGARYFLEIDYANDSTRRALVNVGEISDATMYRFSVNLAADESPTQVRLMYSPTAYPDIDVENADLKHIRELAPPDDPLPAIVTAGLGNLRESGLSLTELCTAGLNCQTRSAHLTWLAGVGSVHFQPPGDDPAPPAMCSEHGAISRVVVPVRSEDDTEGTVIMHGQRIIEASGTRIAVPLNDRTPWLSSPAQTQSIRLWLPYEENQGLPPGTWTVPETYAITRFVDGEPAGTIRVAISVRSYNIIDADISEGAYNTTPTVQSPQGEEGRSSVYFNVADPQTGPTGRVWWNGGDDPVQLRLPVIDTETNELQTLLVDAWKVACNQRWDLHSAQSANWDCQNYAHLEVAAAGNEGLVPGRTYVSPGTAPLHIFARRWHAPNANQILQEQVIRFTYTVPEE
jgi:hypothetical protein